MTASPTASILAHPGARQFAKFCIVGMSSFALDIGTYNILLHFGAAPALALSVGFLVGVTNAYTWNSRWTFRERRGDARRQVPLFFATNLVGFFLNAAVSAIVLIAGAHFHWTHVHHTPLETIELLLLRSAKSSGGFSTLALNAAKICATIVVTIWNFGASKFITFREPAAGSASRVPQPRDA